MAVDTGLPFLTFEHPARGRQAVPLSAKAGLATIGRRPDSDVALPWDPNVSRVHAQLQQVGGEWVIAGDGLSYNGTDMNGQPLAGRGRVNDSDVITVGLTRLTYHAPRDPSSATATAQPRKPPLHSPRASGGFSPRYAGRA